MESLNISLPSAMRDFIDERVKQSRYATPSDYVESLIREDQIRTERKKLEMMLLESRNSGEPIVINDDAQLAAHFEKKKQDVIAKYGAGAGR